METPGMDSVEGLEDTKLLDNTLSSEELVCISVAAVAVVLVSLCYLPIIINKNSAKLKNVFPSGTKNGVGEDKKEAGEGNKNAKLNNNSSSGTKNGVGEDEKEAGEGDKNSKLNNNSSSAKKEKEVKDKEEVKEKVTNGDSSSRITGIAAASAAGGEDNRRKEGKKKERRRGERERRS